jgi:hypothetical protein
MERVNDRCGKPLEVVGKRRGGRRLDNILQSGRADPAALCDGAELRNRPAGNGNCELLARLSAAQHLADVVA